MKLTLDVDSLAEDFFDDTQMLGIAAPIKNYQLCWKLNNALGFNFYLNADLEVQLRKKNRNYYFNIYQSNEPNSFLKHYLYHNHFDGEYLMPEFKHIDFIWLMKDGNLEPDKYNWLKQSIKNITGVQLVMEINKDQVKNKGNMIF